MYYKFSERNYRVDMAIELTNSSNLLHIEYPHIYGRNNIQLPVHFGLLICHPLRTESIMMSLE